MASGTVGPDGRNQSLTYNNPPTGGVYRIRVRTSAIGGEYLLKTQVDSLVAGLNVFYNNSAFDGNDAAANAADDAAIATDKSALLPGSAASVANYTSYNRGINGVMIDLANLHGTPTVDDFSFAMGNGGSPDTWSAAPTPASISVRAGAPALAVRIA